MTGRPRRRVLIGGAVAAVLLAACSDAGDLSVVNNGPGDVTVDTGDEKFTVEPDGGTVLLDYGCTPGDVTITFVTGSETVLPGPVCPDQEIVVGGGTATLRVPPGAHDGTAQAPATSLSAAL